MRTPAKILIASVALAGAAAGVAKDTKDVVLDRLVQPAAPTATAAVPGDAMAVSVLLESPDGSLSPRAVNALFHTGDRLRIKLLASRDGRVSIYNTTPQGELTREPVWRGEAKAGLETLSARLRLEGPSGVDQLHILLEPPREPGLLAWLGNWLGSVPKDGSAKDVRLDVQNTSTTTYLLNAGGKGMVTTMQIVHR